MSSELESEILKMLFDELGVDGVSSESSLFDSGLLDSLDVLTLMTALENKFKIKVSPFDVTIEDFDNAKLISQLVTKLKK